MNDSITNIVIVGGGTAGWLTCAVIAAEHYAKSKQGMTVTLIESPDVPTVGVGEGTWPTMRGTLRKAGIKESDLFRECDASFKQGAKFCKWVTGEPDDVFYHPFVAPQGYYDINLVPFWQPHADKISFADAVSFQGAICKHGLAPKKRNTPEYAHVADYAYHLDALKFAAFLKKHCINVLGAKHVLDHVVEVNSSSNGDIESLSTREHGIIEGDLFVDCSGFKSLLLGEHYGIEFKDCDSQLFNDSALFTQVPYKNQDSPIESTTVSTAQSSGWIWDIGLPTRRGVGYVYSSRYIDDTKAEGELRQYIGESRPELAYGLHLKKITNRPGHRTKFWHKNCVAVGLSAGFLEPLEDPSLVLIELSAAMISEQMPVNRKTMDIVAQRFNDKFLYRWDKVIDFLKLHYVLSKRDDSQYWVDNRKPETLSDELTTLLSLWEFQAPWLQDFPNVDEVFHSASYQYILYGMGFRTDFANTKCLSMREQLAQQHLQKNHQLTQKLTGGLPTNRELINAIIEYGLRVA
jgi:flavin-dependent dehydrogenase